MSSAVATIVVAVVGVIGAILGAAVSAWLNRDRDDAEIAERMSKAWDPVFNRYDKDFERLEKKCTKCETTVEFLRKDFGSFTDVMEALFAEIGPVVSAEQQRKAHVSIAAARMSHLTHNA